jgi:hypothetical protein
MVSFLDDIWKPVIGGFVNVSKNNTNITPMGGVFASSASTAWNGLSTAGKVLVGAGAATGAYAAYDWLFGNKKQPMGPQSQVLDQKPTQDNRPNVNYNYDARQNVQNTTNVDNRSWMNIINSPGASMTKKDSVAASATATPSITTPFSFSSNPTQDTSGNQKQSQASGIDWATIAAIAGVALVAYGYTSRKGSK